MGGMTGALEWLVRELDACGSAIDEATVWRLLTEARLDRAEVSPYVEERTDSYARRSVARREHFEVLVLTWGPSQGSVAHDHSGSLCGLRAVEGRLLEQLFEEGPDGQVRRTGANRLGAGDVIVDPGVVVHSLANDGPAQDLAQCELLVTVHIYVPPLPEVRRYAVVEGPPARVFLRPAPPDARIAAIIGGGFTGVMTLSNLLRIGNDCDKPLHIVLIDRQPAIGEGIAYRTNDRRHLLNVAAGKMSSWPDRPDDFVAFARRSDPAVSAEDYLPRRVYGRYIRETMFALAEMAKGHLSVEVVHDDVTTLKPSPSSGWQIETAGGRTIRAGAAVLAVGHRPPDDPFIDGWVGPRHRLVADPWAALVLSQIGPDEPVLLVGSGLTAVDVILTLTRQSRRAPLIAISRRGLMPLRHRERQESDADLSDLLAHWLDPSTPLTIRRMLSMLRLCARRARERGVEWQRVIDGLRCGIPAIWHRLNTRERARFLAHARPFWEIHRHRTAPEVGHAVDELRGQGLLEVTAGSLISAEADAEGVDVTFRARGKSTARTVRVAWVVNCTGPGVHNRHSTHAFLRPLIEDGTVCGDELDLGLVTDSDGRAIGADGQPHRNLLVAGTLRKGTLWESTAVPELREQAKVAAETALETLIGQERVGVGASTIT